MSSRSMYARLSDALLGRANRSFTVCASVAPRSSPSPTAQRERTYLMGSGTLTTSTWPPVDAPVIVTATSVVRQIPSDSAPAPTLPPLCISRAVLDATSAHPRHLRMTLSRSPIWYAGATRSQRGCAIGCSTLSFTTKSFVATTASAEETANTDAPLPSSSSLPFNGSAASPAQTKGADDRDDYHRNNGTNSSGRDETRSHDTSSPTPTKAVVTGTVMLPDALVFSFKGNPHEFQDRLRGANVLVFFYKAACGPCAVIRSKLIHAVTDHLPMGANPFLQGADGRRRILVAHRHKDVAPPPAAPQETVDDADDGDKVPGSASPPREDTHGTFSAAAASAEASMATEDREACERACRTLEDVSKAFPHRMIFLTVDTNENPKLTALHDIRSLPTFIAYRNGRMVGRVEGADEQEVSKLVHTITKEGGAPQTGTSDAETTEGVQRAA